MGENDPNLDPDEKGEGAAGAAGESGAATPKRMVPLEALEAERGKRQHVEGRVSQLSEQVAELVKANGQAPETRQYSRTELEQLVSSGQLTEAAANQKLDDQQSERIEKQVGDRLSKEASERDRVSRVSADYTAYTEAVPNVLVEGSEERTRITAEVDYLVGLGHPYDKVTEVLAMRSVFGPPSGLGKVGELNLETHQETGSPGGGEDTHRTDGPLKGLSKRERAFYQVQIEKGRYTGWEDETLIRELTEHADPDLRRRMGARYP